MKFLHKLIFISLIVYTTTVTNPEFSMPINPREKACIIEAVWHEARGEPLNGRIAVINVISNRVYSRFYSSSYCDVIGEHKQFSYKHQIKNKKPLVNEANRLLYLEIETLSEKALEGSILKVVPDNVLWYHHTRVSPNWSKRMKTHTVIGSHKFLRKV